MGDADPLWSVAWRLGVFLRTAHKVGHLKLVVFCRGDDFLRYGEPPLVEGESEDWLNAVYVGGEEEEKESNSSPSESSSASSSSLSYADRYSNAPLVEQTLDGHPLILEFLDEEVRKEEEEEEREEAQRISAPCKN